MKRKVVIAFMLALTCILSACSGAGNESSSPAESSTPEVQYGEFETVLRFLVTSDTHVSAVTDTSATRLAKLLTSAYAYADTQDYKKVDALVVAGDLTNYGQPYEFEAWKRIVNDNIKEETQLITVMGNHEYYCNLDDLSVGEKNYKENMDAEDNKHVVINGYHFIGVSTYGEGDYSADIQWLEEALASAANDDPEKPIITFQHHHIQDTVYVSSEWYSMHSKELNAAYSKYSQVINFSGHSHGPINNLTSCFQKDYTLFGTGTLAYFEMTTGMTYGTVPPGADKAGQYYIVEVSADNRVRVLPYNLLTDDFFKTADGSKQLVYEINDLKDKSTWAYTKENRADKSAAPVFAQDAAVTVGIVTAVSAEITFPQATDDDCIYSYNIVCTAANGEKKEFNYFSEYYFEPMPEALTFTLAGLASETEYKVEVYPVDVFGKKGECISASFTTDAKEVVDYVSENEVNFTGTFTNFDSVEDLTASENNLAYGGKVNGDIYVGTWNSAEADANSRFELTQNGYQGSNALSVWSEGRDNQGLYIFATEQNKNTASFPSTAYLRVWVDFTDVEFRKANFGLVSPTGDLYTTDESDYVPDLYFYYLAEGSDEWVEYKHGGDGCFGKEQSTPVKGFKGWMAFPVKDFTYRYGTGSGTGTGGEAYPLNEIAGVYMFWNYAGSTTSGTKFVLDELQLVEDYTVFEEYSK